MEYSYEKIKEKIEKDKDTRIMNVELSLMLASDFSVKVYERDDGRFDAVMGDEIYTFSARKRTRLNKWQAVAAIAVLGPFGFLFYGISAFGLAFLYYFAGVLIFPPAAPFIHILACMAPFIMMSGYQKIKDKELLRKAKEYSNKRSDRQKSERKKLEDDYYKDQGGSKIKNILFGDPNARKSLFKASESFTAAIKNRDLSKFKDGVENMKDANDPAKAWKKNKDKKAS